jgi:hypothetical protein
MELGVTQCTKNSGKDYFLNKKPFFHGRMSFFEWKLSYSLHSLHLKKVEFVLQTGLCLSMM